MKNNSDGFTQWEMTKVILLFLGIFWLGSTIVNQSTSCLQPTYFDSNPIDAVEQSGPIGASVLFLDRIDQVGEGVLSNALNFPARLLESLGFENNFLQRVTATQQIGIYRAWIEERTPDRLAEFDAAVASEGYSPCAHFIGGFLLPFAVVIVMLVGLRKYVRRLFKK